MLYVHRYMFGLIKPVLEEEWSLGNDELGVLDSAFALCYTGFQLPFGIAADVLGVHLVLTLLIVLWSLGLGLHAWAPTTRAMWFARALMGMGQSAVLASQSSITKTWFARASRTVVQGWMGVFFSRFGGLSANLLVGSLLLGVFEIPWRTVVLVMAGLGLVHALVFACLFRNSPRRHPLVNAAECAAIESDQVPGEPTGAVDSILESKSGGGLASENMSPGAFPDSALPGVKDDDQSTRRRMTFRQMLSNMTPLAICNLVFLNVQSILSTLADNVFSSWIPLFLWQEHSLKFKEMGFYASLPLLGGAIGGALGGVLNDRLIKLTGSRRWARSIVGAAGKGIAGGLLLVALLCYDSPYLFCFMLFFVKFFSDWSLTTTWGTITDIGGRASATVFAFNNTVAGVGGIVAPLIYGSVSEHYSWMHVFVTAAIVYLVCALSWFLINSNLPVLKDHEPATGNGS